MPSKKSGRAGKLMRFMKPQGPNQPNFAVPELKVKRNVANLSIRQYMGIEEVRQTETKGAFYASTNGNPKRANKPKKGKPQMVSRPKNGFDVLSKDEAKHQEEEPQVKANAVTVTRVEPVDTDEPREESQEPKEDSVSELSQRDEKILEEFDAKQKAEQEERASPDYSWRYKPELPTADELCPEPDTEVAISPNIIDGAWATKEAYLKTHYDLCREDALGPLIDAVAAVREKPGMCDDNKTCIYEKVHISGITFTHMGAAVRVQFSSFRAQKNILWEYSSRLMFGDLVALTPKDDAFKSICIIASVAARPLEGVKKTPQEVDLFFAHADQAEIDTQKEFLMVQAKSGYYEAHRHVLTALQRMAKEDFSFSKYICSLERNIATPDFIQKKPHFDMYELFGSDDIEYKSVNVLDNWPSRPPSLDETQWDALHEILTKELAIVQGPPGTGKTYVSVVALKLLLSRQTSKDPPIIIAAQTNHALDQLLRLIMEFEPNYIRLGSRSKDQDIKKRTLYKVRQRMPTPPLEGGLLGPAQKKRKQLQEEMKMLLAEFTTECSKSILPAKFFQKLGLLTEKQYEKLVEGTKGWVNSEEIDEDPLSFWLDDQKEEFKIHYKDENFGFKEDEIDLEYEQLKELEAEQGIDEDIDEELRGETVFLKEGFKGLLNHRKKTSPQVYLKGNDLWDVQDNQRGSVYAYLQEKAKSIIRDKFRSLYAEYQKACYQIQCGKYERDTPILQSTKVLAMTTTGLNKYRPLLQSVQPRTILIEEAAEVIEAPVVSACFPTLEHLVLVGDHQQLQGHCTVQELEGEPFYLNVSMFERLVKNDMPYKTLLRQRRMAPAIREVINPIYPKLGDHESVLEREPPPGVGGLNSFFLHHNWAESADSLSSRVNDAEAHMVASFYRYLRLNDVPPERITVLTFYNGQRKKILKYLRDDVLLAGEYLKVNTVDSYQGEENDIIILSLVRSNDHGGGIGFLSIENRVCVALSRAKRGLYIFGNAKCLAEQSLLWAEVIATMEAQGGRFGTRLPLVCMKHNATTLVKSGEEIDKLHGGCGAKCQEMLDCGHQCPLDCHLISHERITCKEPCSRILGCTHRCSRRCGQICRCENNCQGVLERQMLAMDSEDEASDIAGEEWEEMPRGRSPVKHLAASPDDLAGSWHEFARSENKQRSELVTTMNGKPPVTTDLLGLDDDNEVDLLGDENLPSSVSKTAEVTITHNRKAQMSSNEKGGTTRYKWQSTYNVSQKEALEVEKGVAAIDLEESPVNEKVTSTPDDQIGDLIEL